MRRLFRRLEVLAVVVVAICLAVLSGGQQPSRAQLQLASGPGGSLTLSNDKEGAAVLSLGGMRPGDSVTDTVTLGNTGTLDGDLSLATSNLVDTPGSGGGMLSGELDLRIRDVTVPASPVVVYNGKIDALTPVALGTLAAGATRVYEFRVLFPDAGPGAENAYQGSAVSVQFDWSAFNGGPDRRPARDDDHVRPGCPLGEPGCDVRVHRRRVGQHVRVLRGQRRVRVLHQPRHVHRPLGRLPHLRRARHGQLDEYRPDSGQRLLDDRRDRAERLPGRPGLAAPRHGHPEPFGR